MIPKQGPTRRYGIAALLLSGTMFAACSGDNPIVQDGPVQRTSEKLVSAPSLNYVVTNISHAAETTVAFQQGCNNARGSWVAGWNNKAAGSTFNVAGWSRSTTALANQWTTTAMSENGLQFGDPGPSPFNGSAFDHWRGDPALTAVTDPAANVNSGGEVTNTRILYANVSSAADGSTHDAIVAYSDDCGATNFKGTSYINTGVSGGGFADQPSLATNPATPYSTFASWTDSNHSVAWISQIAFTAAGVFSRANGGAIPVPPGEVAAIYPNIAIGNYTDCANRTHELVWVVYQNGPVGRCPQDNNPHLQDIAWYVDAYDGLRGVWLGAKLLQHEIGTWPQCIGVAKMVNNSASARIAADAGNTGRVWATKTASGDWGTRLTINALQAACTNGTEAITNNLAFRAPDPCNLDPVLQVCRSGPGGTGTGGPGNGKIIQDDFGQAISFAYRGATPVVVATMNSMRDDINDNRASTWMFYSENYGTFQGPIRISVQTPNSAERLPYDTSFEDWLDYQAVGTNRKGAFLAAWGADTRLAGRAGNGRIGQVWTALLQ